MAKARKKLGKFLKKMQSLRKTTSNNNNVTRSTSSNFGSGAYSGSRLGSGSSSHKLCPVYVGKSRRQYMVSPDLLDHPLLRELVERSGGGDEIVIGCEVVLFEHLLWMLDNADDDTQPESLDELVDFYAY